MIFISGAGNKVSEALVLEAQFLPFHLQSGGLPLALSVTEYHFLALFTNRLQLICRITGRIVEDESLTSVVMADTPVGLVKDVTMNSFWLFSATNLFQVQRIYLLFVTVTVSVNIIRLLML